LGRGTREEGEWHWVRVALGEGEGTDASVTGYFFLDVAHGKGMTADLVDHRTGEWSWVLTRPFTRE
jgi:hypothetical protein